MGWSQPAAECLTYASWAVAGSSTADPAPAKRIPSTESRESRETVSFLLSSIENFDGPQIDIVGYRRGLLNKSSLHSPGQNGKLAGPPPLPPNTGRRNRPS